MARQRTDTLYPHRDPPGSAGGAVTSVNGLTGDVTITSVSGNAGTATTLQTTRTIDGQNFNGSANITVIAPGTHAASSKTTPVDADELPLVDSAASNILKKLTWANLKATLSTGAVLQVVSTTKTDTFSTSSTSPTDVTGLSASITPASSSNKVLVRVTMYVGMDNGGERINAFLVRGSTTICIGDAASSRVRSSGNTTVGSQSANNQSLLVIEFEDSPATTSATTYKVQVASVLASAVYVNRSSADTDSGASSRTASTITVMEVT